MAAVKRLVVAMTGASGSTLCLDLLRRLRAVPGWESHLVVSRGAQITMDHEYPGQREALAGLADTVYDNDNIGAAVASGSFETAGMAVVPCSMKTVAGIHSGYADNLILRAADVTIKEGRPLVLVPREAPFSPIHLRNMYELSMMGVIILPPVMTFYNQPQGVEDMVAHLTSKVLERFGMVLDRHRGWQGL